MSEFWSALSSIGTILAVIVALWQTHRPKVRNLLVSKTFIEKENDGILEMIVTLDNIGDVSIIVTECGFSMVDIGRKALYVTYENIKCIEKRKINTIETSMNKYIENSEFPLLIKSGDSALIRYRYDFGRPFNIDGEDISSTREYKQFKNGVILVRDSRNKNYIG